MSDVVGNRSRIVMHIWINKKEFALWDYVFHIRSLVIKSVKSVACKTNLKKLLSHLMGFTSSYLAKHFPNTNTLTNSFKQLWMIPTAESICLIHLIQKYICAGDCIPSLTDKQSSCDKLTILFSVSCWKNYTILYFLVVRFGNTV